MSRDVLAYGAYTAQRALAARVLDELHIHWIPVLFGGGRRLFELSPSCFELEIVRVIDAAEATHIRYRVVKYEEKLYAKPYRLLNLILDGSSVD